MKRLFTILVGVLLSHAVYAAQLFGTVDAIVGSATMLDQSGGTYNVSRGQKVFEGYTINVADSSEMHITTVDGGLIALRSNTSFRVDRYKANGGASDRVFMTLFKGAARSITGWIGRRNTASYRLTTPTATIGIRGTDHETIVIDKVDKYKPKSTSLAGIHDDSDELDPNASSGTYDTVNEGSTLLKTPYGEAEVRPGKFAFAPKDKAVAPVQLASAPKFFVTRRLKIEGRVTSQKDFLRNNLDKMLDERVKQVKDSGEGQDGDDEILTDPTEPTSLTTPPAPPPVLQSVYLARGRTAAVINGQEVKLGEKFGDATLIKVQDNEVTLRNANGELQTIKMYPDIEKTPTNQGKK